MALKVGIITGGTFQGWIVAQDDAHDFTTTARPVVDPEERVHFAQVLVTGTTAGTYGTAASYVAPPALRQVPLVALASWVSDRRERFAELGFPLPLMKADVDPDWVAALELAETPKRLLPMRVTGANATRKPRGFYERIAERYRQLVERNDRHPATTIAAANGVSAEVVHQWIKKCRREGFLGPATVGRASAGAPVRARPVKDVPPPERADIDRSKSRRERKPGWDVDEGQP